MAKAVATPLPADEVEETEEETQEETPEPEAEAKPTPTPEPEPENKPEPEPMFSQTEVGRKLSEERERVRSQYADYDDLKAKAEELGTTKAEKASLEAEVLKLRVALEKGLPVAIVDRLRGDTIEELEADADTLASFIKKGGSFDGGARKTAPKPTDETGFLTEVLLGEKK